jgi:hypothetical protein
MMIHKVRPSVIIYWVKTSMLVIIRSAAAHIYMSLRASSATVGTAVSLSHRAAALFILLSLVDIHLSNNHLLKPISE